MIAATALATGFPLYTANPDDFAGIDGLVVRPVSAPENAVVVIQVRPGHAVGLAAANQSSRPSVGIS